MPLTGDEIRRQLGEFAAQWGGYTGAEREIGLTQLYNEVEEGAYSDLADLHLSLDRAVAATYGWPASAATDPEETNRLLLELNRQIAGGERPYESF